jgi:AmiR/NasT family two-component response regulator
MSKILEHNVETGEVIERDPTTKELAQMKKDTAEEAARLAEREAKETAKAALLDRLGITAEEAALLLG